jgi:cobalt-zinc-cadmium efflux system outer membrane protein
MPSKDAWSRPMLCGWLIASAALVVAPAGCNHLGRSVYYPAPTPVFMEEGLREEPGGGRPVILVNAAEGVSGLLNPAEAEVAKAAHVAAQETRGQETGDRRQGTGDRGQDLPPPTAPPGPPTTNGLQPAMPEYLPGAPRVGPYEQLPPGASGVTLGQAIDEALNTSVAIRQELESVVQSQADVRTAALFPNPQLMVLSSLLPWPGHPFNPTRQGGPPQYDIWAVWPIDWYLFGKRRAEIEAKARQVDVSAAEFADFVRQRIQQTVATFFAVLEARALLQVSRENAESLRRVVDLTQNRFVNEAAARIDVERAQIVLSNANRDIRTGEATLAAAKAQLRALMGRQGLDPAFDVAGTLNTGRPVGPPPVEYALSIADQWRPDMLAAWRRVDLARAQVVVEDTRRFPAVGVQTGWTYQDQRKAIGFPGEPSWNTGVTFPLPVFDRNQGNRWKARSELIQAQMALDTRRIQVQSEVEQAIASYEAAYRIVTSDAPQQLEAARSVRDRMVEAFREGGRTLFELLNAEQTYRDTYRLQINAEVGYWRAIHQLNAVVGQQIVP